MPTRAHRYLIPLAAIIPIIPLLMAGASCGHDFDFHILSWFEAAQQLIHAHYPLWAYTPAYNAGEPRFLFYPPLSWFTGSVLGLLMPWHYAPIAFTWIALTLSGLSLHRLALRYSSATSATLAAVFYLCNPYMLFTAYERTAYGELLAAAWIPLLLAAIFAPRVSVVAIAIPVALLWVSNAPAAVLSCYALALLALVRLLAVARPSRRPSSIPPQPPLELLRNTFFGVVLGLALAAFYILPAAMERSTVQTAMATVTGMRIADNTLFHHTTDEAHDAVLHTASMIAFLLITATVMCLAALQGTRTPRKHGRGRTGLLLPLVILTAAVAFLLTPWSLPIWRHAPELLFLQFPWRLLVLIAAILAFTMALVLRNLHFKALPLAVVALCLTGLLSVPEYHRFEQPCDAPDTVEARYALFHSPDGSEPTDEYTPASADNDALKHPNPPYWLATDPKAQPPAGAQAGSLPDHFTLNVPAPETLILNRRLYPGWRITLNGLPATLAPPATREDGLIAVPVPAGQVTVEMTLHRPAAEYVGFGISGCALLALFLMRRKNTPPNPLG